MAGGNGAEGRVMSFKRRRVDVQSNQVADDMGGLSITSDLSRIIIGFLLVGQNRNPALRKWKKI